MRTRWDLFLGRLIPLVSPLAPLLLGGIVLQLYGPSGEPLTSDELKCIHNTTASFASGLVTYVAVTALHYVVCMVTCVIIIFRYLDSDDKTKAILRPFLLPIFVISITLFILFLLGPLMSKNIISISIFELSSNNMYEIYNISSSCEQITSKILTICQFVVASTLPVFFAVVAAILLVAFMNAQVFLFDYAKEYERDIRSITCRRSIMQCFPLLSSLLVTGVISSAFWFHLPARIYGSAWGNNPSDPIQQSALQRLQDYGDEMALFWGMMYTLMALVAIALPIGRLSRKEHAVGLRSPETDSTISFFLLSKHVLLVLAPLISSLLVNWLGNS